jgi:hypothetical protein
MSDFLLDIVHNSVQAGSPVTDVVLVESASVFDMSVHDTGSGMDEAEVIRAQDPFGTDAAKHPVRNVGLGLPFLVQLLSDTDGSFRIESKKGRGTDVWFSFNLNHVDTPPMGNLVDVLVLLMSFDGEYELTVRRTKRREESAGARPGSCSYELRRSLLTGVLGELQSVSSRGLLHEYIRSQEENLDDC